MPNKKKTIPRKFTPELKLYVLESLKKHKQECLKGSLQIAIDKQTNIPNSKRRIQNHTHTHTHIHTQRHARTHAPNHTNSYTQTRITITNTKYTHTHTHITSKKYTMITLGKYINIRLLRV